MRKGLVVSVVLLAVIVIGGVAEYGFDWPVAWSQGSPSYRSPNGSSADNAGVPRYSNVRGLQDAPRDDVALGTVFDMQHCLSTMNLRGLRPDEAHHTCEQLIAGISKIY